MLAVLCVYLALSLAIGLVASLGFLLGAGFCRRVWWSALMRVCPLSWLAVAAFFIAYGFYAARAKKAQ